MIEAHPAQWRADEEFDQNAFEEIMSTHSGQEMEKVSKDMERDFFMTSEEAVKYGIIDTVIEHR